MTEDCLFCRIYREQSGIIHENNNFYAQFDKFPVNPGHAEVIPKKHDVKKYDNEEEFLKDSDKHLATKFKYGRYGFILKNIKRIKSIPHKGQLNLFNVQIR